MSISADNNLQLNIQNILASKDDASQQTNALRDLMEQFSPEKVLGALMEMLPMIASAISG